MLCVVKTKKLEEFGSSSFPAIIFHNKYQTRLNRFYPNCTRTQKEHFIAIKTTNKTYKTGKLRDEVF